MHVPLLKRSPLPLLRIFIQSTTRLKICPITFHIITQHQVNHKWIQQLCSNGTCEMKNVYGANLTFFQQKNVIPSSLLDRIIIWYHELLNHPGKDHTYRTISQNFYARGMEARIQLLIRRCSCKKANAWQKVMATFLPLPSRMSSRSVCKLIYSALKVIIVLTVLNVPSKPFHLLT